MYTVTSSYYDLSILSNNLILNLCIIFMLLLSPADFFFKIKMNSLKNSFWNSIRISNGMDPDQGRRSDLGPKLFAKIISRRQKSPLATKDFI